MKRTWRSKEGRDVEEDRFDGESLLKDLGEGAYTEGFGGVVAAAEEPGGEFVGHGRDDVVGFACEENVDGFGDRLIDIEGGVSGDDPDPLDGRRALAVGSDLAAKGSKDIVDDAGKICDRERRGKVAKEADLLAFVLGPGLEVLKLEGTG